MTHSDNASANGAHAADRPLVDFMERFVASRQFQQVFEEGMRLVEETADFLDGPGRALARGMNRDAAMTYATESMRLTTRLMQLASWLLLQRAVAAGELTEQDARKEQENINLDGLAQDMDDTTLSQLPEGLVDLIRRGQSLYERVLRLDEKIRHRADATPEQASGNPLSGMLDRISSEFGSGGTES